jgi:rare lipoprotein A
MGRKGEFDAFAPVARVVCVAAGCLVLAQCSGGISSRLDPRYGVSASPRVVQLGQPVPKGGGAYRIGKPYVVGGRTYVPRVDPHYRAEGLASWYGEDFHGRLTANGEIFDMNAISAAHPTLPLPCYVRITNLRNGRSIIARVNDRGPYHQDRVADVSAETAKLLGFYQRGTTRARVEYIGPAPLQGSDDRMLMATLREHGPAPARVMLASTASYGSGDDTPVRRSRALPVPQARPYALGEEDESRPAPVRRAAVARSQPREVTAEARVERTMGRQAPAMAWVTGPSGVPSSGVLRSSEPISAYAPRNHGTGSAFMSGQGLY